MAEHSVSEDGESTSNWAMRSDGFMGSIKQLTHCARCGCMPRAKPHDQPRKYFGVMTPSMHLLCDPCFAALPD